MHKLTTQDKPLFIFPKSKRQRLDKSNNNNLNNLKDKTSYSSSKTNNNNDNTPPPLPPSPPQEAPINLNIIFIKHRLYQKK
ncbi:unnamed protein product [Cunninghamella echinulata]